jgi:hypothetical protein
MPNQGRRQLAGFFVFFTPAHKSNIETIKKTGGHINNAGKINNDSLLCFCFCLIYFVILHRDFF